MSASKPSLLDRYREDLRSGSLAVIATATLAALVGAYVTVWLVGSLVPAVLTLVLVGVQVPSLHEDHWPQAESVGRDVVWTLVTATVALLSFLGLYVLAGLAVDHALAQTVVAFVVVSVVGPVAVGRVAPEE